MFNKLKMVSSKNPKEDWLGEDTNKTVSFYAKNKGKKAKPAKSSYHKIISTVNDNTVHKSMAGNGPPSPFIFPSPRGPDEVSVFLCL